VPHGNGNWGLDVLLAVSLVCKDKLVNIFCRRNVSRSHIFASSKFGNFIFSS
jgi:hypothetical protein